MEHGYINLQINKVIYNYKSIQKENINSKYHIIQNNK